MSSSQINENGFNGLTNLVKQMTESLALFGKRLENLESSRNSNINKKEERPPTFESIGVSEDLGLKIERILNKKQRFENYISIYKTHLEKETTPASLFYCYFPRPFLWDDPDYVTMHNERIRKWQIQQMKQDIDYVNEKISFFDSELLDLKQVIGSNANQVIQKIDEIVDKHLTDFKNSATAKALTIESRKYQVKSKKFDNITDENHSEHSNTNASTSISSETTPMRASKRQRNQFNKNSAQKTNQIKIIIETETIIDTIIVNIISTILVILIQILNRVYQNQHLVSVIQI